MLELVYGVCAKYVGSEYGYSSLSSARRAAKREAEYHGNGSTVVIVDEYRNRTAPDYTRTLRVFRNNNGVVTEEKR